MMNNETRHIDLHLPRGWNECTTEQLEMIAAAIISEQRRADRYHPFDWQRVKLNVVLAINSLSPNPSPKGERSDYQEWMLKRPQEKEPWPVSTGQLLSLTEHLAWLDDQKATMPKMIWPYPKRLWYRSRRMENLALLGKNPLLWFPRLFTTPVGEWWPWPKEYFRPGELLDGLSWTQYRMVNDWMEVYTNVSNALISETQKHGQMTQERIERLSDLARQQDDARLEVLAQLFYVADPAAPCGYRSAPRRLLQKINRVEWQVVLFWWSSMMQYLKQQYPKCYKTTKIRKPKGSGTPLPIELYTQSMAVLVTDLKLTEDEVNRLTAHVVLRRLNMMAEEADEIEKTKHKK